MSGKGRNVDISVVVAVGRVDDFLRLQLESLSAQRFGGRWELVVSRNVAEPAKAQRLEQLIKTVEGPSITIVDSSSVASASHARNIGAEAASADRLAFCDADDLTHPDWLTHIASGLDRYGAVGGALDEEVLAVQGQRGWRPPATPGCLPQFLGYPYLISANMGVDKSLFTRVGGFDTNLIRGEDIDFSWALLDQGVELGYCPDAIVYYRHRRGLWPMLRQHYLYGKGFSQLLARRSMPCGGQHLGAVASLRPNGSHNDHKVIPHYLRRTSIAAGRVVGLVAERRVGSAVRH